MLTLNATIISSAPLPLPSASGIELVGETAFVISDDSPFLYTFRAPDLMAGEPIRLFETAHFSTGRIPKHLKPDLEAITFLPPGPVSSGANDSGAAGGGLLLAGSGATAARESGFWVELTTDTRVGAVYPVSLAALYRALRRHLPRGQPLNIEALATTATELLLFQRPVGTERGRRCFRLPLAQARALLRPTAADAAPPLALRVSPYEAPTLLGHAAGLSGATIAYDRLFVTASVENTTDPVADGEILGSYVGVLDPQKPRKGCFGQLAWPDGRPFREKVEGVAVRQKLANGYELLLVTDDDHGGSTVVIVAVTVA